MIDCLKPYKVFSKSLNRDILVSCGKCLNCLARSANRYSSLCFLQERHHKFTMFVTLTYSNDYLPCCYPFYRLDSELNFVSVSFINVTPRLFKYYDVVHCDYDHDFRKDVNYLFRVSRKPIGFLAQKDIQNFLKRFRKYVNKKIQKDLPFKVFSAGEYGEKHRRPHWHLLFFFDSVELYDKFGQVLHETWQFGRVDFSLSRGGASSYVSRYINSLDNLPSLLTKGFFKSRKQHSVGFSFGSLVERFEDLQDLQIYGFRDFIKTGVHLRGEINPSFFSSYDTFKLLPKFPNSEYSFSNIQELCYLYKGYVFVTQYYLQQGIVFFSVADLARTFLDDINDVSLSSILIEIFRSKMSSFQDRYAFVYKCLSISKKFILDVCHNDLTRVREYVESIIHFYSLRSLNTLSLWYEEMEKYIISSSPFFLFLYDNFLDNHGNILSDFASLPDFARLAESFDDSSYLRLFQKRSYADLCEVNGNYHKALINQIKLHKHKQINSDYYEYYE